MSQRTIDPTRASDRLSYLWLVVAAALFLFSAGRWEIALAAWLAPLFLLRFVRTQRLLTGLLLAWLVRFAVAAVADQGFIPAPGIFYYVIVLFLILVQMLPYAADRLIAPRLKGFVATLVFPTAFTTLEYLSSFGPFGTLPSIANSQYGNLPLLQVLSVTGIWGIIFLITWFAAVANWAWEHEFAWPQVRGGVLLYAGILAVVLLGGGARLALFPPQANLVRVAGLNAPQAALTALDQVQDPSVIMSMGKLTQAQRAVLHTAYAAVDDALLAGTQQEAAAGAKIVVWPEVGAQVLQEDEPALIRRASDLAKQQGIYLDMGLAVVARDPAGRAPVMDEAVLLDPTGKVVWTYEKSHLVPFSEPGLIVPGDGRVPMVDTPYGRLANVICYDLDFPGTIRQAGQARADLLLGPSNDWQAIDPAHTQAATFRAIEDGTSLVRQAGHGLSMAVDYQGHVLAASDYFDTPRQVMVAYVPMHGVRTVYAAIGDAFAWLCLVVLVTLTGAAIIGSRKHAPGAVAPLPEPGALR